MWNIKENIQFKRGTFLEKIPLLRLPDVLNLQQIEILPGLHRLPLSERDPRNDMLKIFHNPKPPNYSLISPNLPVIYAISANLDFTLSRASPRR